MVYEESLQNLFKWPQLNISEATDIFRDKFLLEKTEAELLAKYLILKDLDESKRTAIYDISSTKLIKEIIELAGKYSKIDSNQMVLIKEEIKSKSTTNVINKLALRLKLINKKGFVYLPDFKKEIIESGMLLNLDTLSVLLLRKSNSLMKIDSKVIQSEVIDFLEALKSEPGLNRRKTKKISK